MTVACLAVIAILLAMSYIYVRAGRKNYALAILPLMLVPVVHAGAGVAYSLLSRFLTWDFNLFAIAADVVALVAACTIFGFLSAKIETKKARMVFLIMCDGFTALFTFALVWSLIQELL